MNNHGIEEASLTIDVEKSGEMKGLIVLKSERHTMWLSLATATWLAQQLLSRVSEERK